MMHEQVGKIIPINNYVLVKPHLGDGDSNVSNLRMDTSFDPANHAPRTGVVISVPKSLEFDENKTNLMPWETQMELRAGDQVWYHYLTGLTAEDKHMSRFIDYNDERYFFIKYDRIFVAKRLEVNLATIEKYRDRIICLNGFVLVEPMPQADLQKYKDYLVLPKNKDATLGIIRHLGSPVTNYGKVYKNWHGPDSDNVKVGDVVAMDQNCNIPLQYDLKADLEDGNMFYRVQRRYLLAKL